MCLTYFSRLSRTLVHGMYIIKKKCFSSGRFASAAAFHCGFEYHKRKLITCECTNNCSDCGCYFISVNCMFVKVACDAGLDVMCVLSFNLKKAIARTKAHVIKLRALHGTLIFYCSVFNKFIS